MTNPLIARVAVGVPDAGSTIERVWRRNLASASDAIPQDWLVTLSDGFVGIDSVRADEPMVKMYRGLLCVGYARGWL